MKRRLLPLFILLVFFGCASMPVDQKPVEVKLKIEGVENVKVTTGDDKVTKAMEVNNPEGSLSQLSFISLKNKKAFIKIFSGLSVADVIRLWNDIIWLENNSDIKDIDLFINSPGGDAFSGLAIADEIDRARKKGFNITAHASGIIASAAVPVFASCNLRYAAPGTIFMVHEAALWKWPGRETASDIRSQNELMILLGDRYRKILASHSKIDIAKWCSLEEKTTWFDADKALEWGLIDKIE